MFCGKIGLFLDSMLIDYGIGVKPSLKSSTGFQVYSMIIQVADNNTPTSQSWLFEKFPFSCCPVFEHFCGQCIPKTTFTLPVGLT